MLSTARFVALTGLISLTGGVVSAQTTGVPGFNDFTIGGSTSASTSCPFIGPLTPGVYNFTVNTAPGLAVVLIINFNCPCTPCTLPFPPTPTPCPIPFSACGATTNQSLDLNPGLPGCVFIAVPMPVADASGNSTMAVPLPSLIRFGAQAGVAFHPCMTSAPFPIMFTQAYQVSTL